jgi:phage terminase large subunit-like protein
LAAIRAANPASWVSDAYLARQAASPELSDAEFLQLHGCVWAAGTDTFIPMDRWRALGDGTPLERSQPVFVMVDGSYRYDTTAVAWARRADDGRIDVACHVFSARHDAPHHTLCPGGRISLADVEEFVLGVRCREVAFDPRFMARSAEILAEAMPSVPVLELEPQSGAMYDALAFFHRAVADGLVRHSGDPVVAAHVSACQGEQVERGWRVSKRNHTRPIDAVIAMAGAVWRAGQPDTPFVPLVAWA